MRSRPSCLISSGGTAGRMEDGHDPHRLGAAVLDAVGLTRGEVEARAAPQRRRLLVYVRDPFALHDVPDLVVRMTVERRFARQHDAEELRHVRATCVLVDEIA